MFDLFQALIESVRANAVARKDKRHEKRQKAVVSIFGCITGNILDLPFRGNAVQLGASTGVMLERETNSLRGYKLRELNEKPL